MEKENWDWKKDLKMCVEAWSISCFKVSNNEKKFDEVLIEFIQNLLNQKDKEWQQRCKKAKILTAEESYKNGRIIMKAEIREVIEKMKRPTLKKLRKAIKRANEDNTYMNGYHQALKEILKHIK